MMELLHRSLGGARHSGRPLTVVVFEVDEAWDDSSIRGVAEAISSVIRGSDRLGRLFGGRLLLIAPGDLSCGLCFLDRAARAVRERTRLTLRAGIARWPEDGTLPADSIQATDLILKASWHPGHHMNCPVVAGDRSGRPRVSA
jgi:GGDEF domain-containing protein